MSRTNRYCQWKQKLVPDGKNSPHLGRNCPWHWRHIYMIKPRRAKNRLLCYKIIQGFDSENIAFPLGNHKPHWYYW